MTGRSRTHVRFLSSLLEHFSSQARTTSRGSGRSPDNDE
jgi:hypothetical protein